MNLFCILSFTLLSLDVHSAVYIEKNGYKGITVSFSEKALQKPFDFEKLKDVLRDASQLLFTATRNRSYFEEFIFVVPTSWADNACNDVSTELPRNIDVYITDSRDDPLLTTQHSRGCGQKGDIIYMTRDWLAGNTANLAYQFVQKWSTFRYGVFSENPERYGSCFATSDSVWSPTGCYNVELDVEAKYDDYGLPVCYFPDDFKNEEDLRSSIMFSSNSSKVLNYCDGSEFLPHNPVSPTLHNRICGGYSVWSIIEKTEDFLAYRNSPVESAKPPVFRCFKESKIHMTLAVQDTDSEVRTEIRYALIYFLSNVVTDTDLQATLVTFSNVIQTESMNPVDLNLEDKEKLKSLLITHIKLNKKVPDVCFICGLQKAYKVSAESQHAHRVIVLLAFSSSLQNSKDIAQVTELVRRHDRSVVLHLILLEDTSVDAVPPSLVDVMQESRGRLVRVKNDRVFVFTQMNVALLDASKNVLHVEDKIQVIHQKTHHITSNFFDVFRIPKNLRGRLLYSMQCKNRGDVRSDDNGCSILDQELQSPICESKANLDDSGNSSRIWKYSFEYSAGSDGSTCVSLALLKLDSSSIDTLTMKGWLSENKITPGFNALIIYAEVIGRLDGIIRAEAIISGPGLTDFRLELRDNGNGDPDIIKGDNIYSRYFTSFSQKGTYTVSMYVSVSTTEQDLPEESLDEIHNVITQTKVIGTFIVTETPPKEDIIPPNRVCDLNVVSINNTDKTVLLQWTAPGDNYDYGTAKKYIVKVSKHWMSLLNFVFDQKENIVVNLSKFLPRASGTIEKLRIRCTMCNYNTTYFVAIRSIDGNKNKGKTSNIRQIYFKKYDSVNIGTETLITDVSFTPTVIVIETSTALQNETTDENTTAIINETREFIFIKKRDLIIGASSFGIILIIIIVINIIVCFCCFKKNKEKSPKISRKASMRPPYNLNIAYSHGSQSSLEEEKNAVSHSMSTLVDRNTVYSNSDSGHSQTDKKYTYHTSQSLMNKMDSPDIKNNLGFKLVKPMPAYATSSLTRFAAKQRYIDDDTEYSNPSSKDLQHQNSNNVKDTCIYTLGEV